MTINEGWLRATADETDRDSPHTRVERSGEARAEPTIEVTGALSKLLGDCTLMQNLRASIAKVVDGDERLRDEYPPAILVTRVHQRAKILVLVMVVRNLQFKDLDRQTIE